ncbi:MAG: 50S ribosomal protein L6 [Akkermansia muciniphila]
MSELKSITLPDKVTVRLTALPFRWKAPKGKLSGLRKASPLPLKAIAVIARASQLRALRTNRSLLINMVIGVSEGFVKNLEIVGVGFRAAVKGNILDLNLGKSHPINQVIPEGLKVTVTENTKVTVEGIDKQVVGQFAAEVRAYYPPEPYKGKGVRFVGEVIRRKEGKSVGK